MCSATVQPPLEAKYNVWLPKSTLTYKINDDHSVFASLQRGYRAGGSYLTTAADSDVIGSLAFDTYDPEYLDTIEIGNRSIFADGDIVLHANVFSASIIAG